MLSATALRRTTLVVLWAYGLWYSWESCGLSGDGSYFLLEIVRVGGFLPEDFYPTRAYPNAISQVLVVLAIQAGVTDLHWLARLSSFGWFALPALLYSLALVRVRHDAVLQAAVVAVLGIVFMTTSFMVVSEHIPAYAAALAAAAWLAASDRLRLADGLVLLAIAILSLKTYEAFIYFGPLLAAMTAWTVLRSPSRPTAATVLHGLAAALFLGAAWLAARAIMTYDDDVYFASASNEAWDFKKNPTFCLSIMAALIVVLWALARPQDLAGSRPYRWTGLALAALALAPLLTLITPLFGPPYLYGQNIARTAAGPVIVAMIVFMWVHKSTSPLKPKAFAVLASTDAGRRLLAFACLLFLATLPWNVMLVRLYASYLDVVKEATKVRGGVIAFEATRLPSLPYLLQGEAWTMPMTSAIVSQPPGHGMIAPPQAYKGWQPFPLSEMPDLGRFRWRD